VPCPRHIDNAPSSLAAISSTSLHLYVHSEPPLTLARGARQLVVQEALEMMWSLIGSYFSWLTPMTYIGASLEGAVMMTFLAPPTMCCEA
jgi:hypothetical protein